MNMSQPRPSRPRQALSLGLASVALLLASGSSLGCFRASGLSRPSPAVEEIPETGGDRVKGLKSTAGPGDYYIGNDYVQMAVDGASFGDQSGQFGAASGGGILDIGSIALDTSYKRVSMPTDMLERLGPVANQDPELPLVFDRYQVGRDASTNDVYLDMNGYLLDRKGKLGVPVDGEGRVVGVTVDHRIALGSRRSYFTLETTLTNHSGQTLPIRNLGDALSQQGGGFRLVVPATRNFDGTPLSGWGVEIPGTDFNSPLTQSVQAPMVGLMGAESSGSTLDSHSSLGIIPEGADYVLVASDPQHALEEDRPRVPARMVVGSPAAADLPDGGSLTYRRRLYVTGGTSVSANTPAQTTLVFNSMVSDHLGLVGGDYGILSFASFGTAAPGGALQAEYRFERYTGSAADPKTDTDPSHWSLERVEWRESGEIQGGAASSLLTVALPAMADPAFPGQNQRYRISVRNRYQSYVMYSASNALNASRPNLVTDIEPSKSQAWQIGQSLAPERGDITDSAGNVITQKVTIHAFSAREAGLNDTGTLQPLRITFVGVDGTPDPDMQRLRRVASNYDAIYKQKTLLTRDAGAYQYRAGNQVFGTSFAIPSSLATAYFDKGSYLALATRGPLTPLESIPVLAYDGQTTVQHQFLIIKKDLPSGWTSFDLPGPTQATTGGLNPGEMLSSALAEQVHVVARTEQDFLTDPTALRSEFRMEFDSNNPNITDVQRSVIGDDPLVVGARSSSLGEGDVTALFTPAPSGARYGGAQPSTGWTLADFLTQAQGQYNIIQRPRGPHGLFTVKGFDPAVALGTGANAWWNDVGPLSLGKKESDFDALELIRGEYSDANGNPLPLTDPANVTAWFQEFLAVRNDWFGLLNQETPNHFTKALGLSASRYSLDTPVGLARTYLDLGSAAPLTQDDLSPVLTALQHGAAVASTGPFLEVSINGTGPGGLVTGPLSTVTLNVSLYAADWVPVDEVRAVVNGVVQTIPLSSFTPSAQDSRLRTATVNLSLPAGKDAWVVVEAGVPLTTTGAYAPGTPWAEVMKGIYPVAVTNPIFVDVAGDGYTPPFP